MRYFSLAAFLFGFWIALSGHYTPLLLSLGVVSSLLCLLVAARLGIVDEEGHPVALLPRVAAYYLWLGKELIRTSWKVAKIILHPKRPISPTVTAVHASQATAVGITTYANSITLTAGSVVGEVDGNDLTVFALDRESALELEDGEMDRRVSRLEGAA